MKIAALLFISQRIDVLITWLKYDYCILISAIISLIRLYNYSVECFVCP